METYDFRLLLELLLLQNLLKELIRATAMVKLCRPLLFTFGLMMKPLFTYNKKIIVQYITNWGH